MLCAEIENILLSRSCKGPSDTIDKLRKMKHLRQFGEMACVKYGPAMKAKLNDQGKPSMHLGRAADHSVETSRLLNMESS